MKTGFLWVAVLGAICSGCATPPEERSVAAAAAPANAATQIPPPRYHDRASITGSRLPPLDDYDPSAAPVSAVTKDDYLHDRNAGMRPLCGGGGPSC